jgi:hypothetical protein
MTYKEIINSIQPIEYSKYANISSNEKLCVYAAYYLEKNGVPLNFNYLCIATYKMFPDKFCADEEFKEFPSVDRLNRTVLHCVRPSNEKNRFLIGDVRLGYALTKMGIAVAEQVGNEIKGLHEKIDTKPVIDKHKKGHITDYLKFIKSDLYKIYQATGEIDLFYVWDYYETFPYSDVDKIKKSLKEISIVAKEKNDTTCIELVEYILRSI